MVLICGRQIADYNSDMIWAKRTVKAKRVVVVLRQADYGHRTDWTHHLNFDSGPQNTAWTF